VAKYSTSEQISSPSGRSLRDGRSLPSALEHIITKALEKDRRLKYQTAASIREEPSDVKTRTRIGARVAVAVEARPNPQKGRLGSRRGGGRGLHRSLRQCSVFSSARAGNTNSTSDRSSTRRGRIGPREDHTSCDSTFTGPADTPPFHTSPLLTQRDSRFVRGRSR
jgi:hypothetical protein